MVQVEDLAESLSDSSNAVKTETVQWTGSRHENRWHVGIATLFESLFRLLPSFGAESDRPI